MSGIFLYFILFLSFLFYGLSILYSDARQFTLFVKPLLTQELAPQSYSYVLRRRNTRYKNPKIVRASFGRCFALFAARDQLLAQKETFVAG